MDHRSLIVAALALIVALVVSPYLGNVGLLSGGKGAVS
jgi:hypothetical protein